MSDDEMKKGMVQIQAQGDETIDRLCHAMKVPTPKDDLTRQMLRIILSDHTTKVLNLAIPLARKKKEG